ncbi:hypothetical protein [Ruegeria sp. HKCCD9179]|uniref:hypothetical protein n=1 Tax=Ruegeria sp. HKCCD9179 TaxID=2683016 RepID=UPI00148905E3|nr:hypothetical protein [Ruegeria sp. HKCCD9179]
MTGEEKKDRITLGHVRLNTLADPVRVERAATQLCEALGAANDPNAPLVSQEGAGLDAVLAFVQEVLPDLRHTGALDVLKRLTQRRFQQSRDLHTREAGKGQPPVAMTEEQLRVFAIASVRFLKQRAGMAKTIARQEVANILRSYGVILAPSALANWEKKWLPAQEIDPHHDPILHEASPVAAVQTVQDALAEAFDPAIHDPVHLVRGVLKKPAVH